MKSPTTDKVIDRLKQPYCTGFVRMEINIPRNKKAQDGGLGLLNWLGN